MEIERNSFLCPRTYRVQTVRELEERTQEYLPPRGLAALTRGTTVHIKLPRAVCVSVCDGGLVIGDVTGGRADVAVRPEDEEDLGSKLREGIPLYDLHLSYSSPNPFVLIGCKYAPPQNPPKESGQKDRTWAQIREALTQRPVGSPGCAYR